MTKRDELIALGGVGVNVKLLEWQRIGDCWKADRYSIRIDHGVPVYYIVRGWDRGTNPHDTLDAAKAAAQADYEQRIRSALVTHPASPPDVEAIRADERERCAAKAMAPVNGMELQRFIVGGVALTDKHGNDVFIAKPDVERLLTERASAIRTGGQK